MSTLVLSERDRSAAWASLVLRVAIASLFLATSVAKLSGGLDNLEGLIEVYEKPFSQTWLPASVVIGYLYTMPFIEAILPLWLLIGVKLRAAWVVTAVYLITLSFGKMVLQDAPTAAQNYGYVLIAAVGLYLSAYDRFKIAPRRSKGLADRADESTPQGQAG